MTSQMKTDTDGRLKKLLQIKVGNQFLESSDKKIAQAFNNSKLKMGIVTKFYPYLDKVEVELQDSNKKVVCRLPHRFMGSLIDFYTPVGDRDYCNKLKEPCIIPRDTLNCLVATIYNGNEDDYLLVTYYLNDEIIGVSPADAGFVKISNYRASNEDFIEFGGDGLKLLTKNRVGFSCGEYSDNITDIHYAEVDNVYTKEEVYTKSEVDEKFAIPSENLDVDFNLNFGLSGRDDIITVEAFLKQIEGE